MANKGVNSLAEFRKRVSTTYELIAAAHHEAGHTVYGLLKLFMIEDVSIFQGKKSKCIEGLTSYRMLPLPSITDPKLFEYTLHAEICFNYAGLVAEKYHFKQISGSDKFPLFLRNGSSDDTLAAAQIIRNFIKLPPGKERYSFKKKLINNTCKDLSEHWEVVLLVAHELFKKKHISYIELKALILKGVKNKLFWKKQFSKIEKLYDDHLVDDNLFKITLGL